MKKLLLILLMVSPLAHSYSEDVEQRFSMTNNLSNNIRIVFQQSPNPAEDCERMNRARGFGGFGYPVQACSFWNYNTGSGDSCLIVTGPDASLHVLGHEIRHCIQGNFHK